MSRFEIRKPVWNGGNRFVGLAEPKITAQNIIEITATDKNGDRIYPNKYKMSGEKLRKYPTKQYPGVPFPLRMVPINDLELTDAD